MPLIFPNWKLFNTIHSSDLNRCADFADIVLGFNGLEAEKLLILEKRLRELNFGSDEGVAYDLLSKEEK